MERKEILEKLKITEAEVRSNIEAAQHKRNEILAQAQRQVHKLEEDSEQKTKKERDDLLSAAKKEMAQKREKTFKKALTDADELKKKAQVKKASEFFIEKFQEYVHV